ncbi:hypothetical protein [Paraburkholderia tropica]|uniref:hypothetical protein n=1 Tax=Paraburkholderia tropica TaxID=92647 RepID=UPI003D2B646E
MTEQGFHTLCAMINMARFEQIRCLSTLKRRLVQQGYAQEHIAEAIQAWAKYGWEKRC